MVTRRKEFFYLQVITYIRVKNDNMETFRNAFVALSRMSELLSTIAEFRDWMDRCDETIRHIVAYQRGERVPLWEKQRMVSLLARTQTMRAIVRGRLSRVGCGHAARATSPKVVWEEVETAFERRLLTGAVINVGAVDPRKFFENARRECHGDIARYERYYGAWQRVGEHRSQRGIHVAGRYGREEFRDA